MSGRGAGFVVAGAGVRQVAPRTGSSRPAGERRIARGHGVEATWTGRRGRSRGGVGVLLGMRRAGARRERSGAGAGRSGGERSPGPVQASPRPAGRWGEGGGRGVR